MSNSYPYLIFEERSSYLNQDDLWKKVITELFESFILFFAPDLYEALDWNKKPISLEQELRRAFPEKKGKRIADKLMKAYLKDGEEQWVLIHIEVQGDGSKDDFTKRMFQSFYRIYDAYDKKIFAIALLADSRRSYKPTTFNYHFFGIHLTYNYHTYKFLEQDEESLWHSDHPFALAVLAGIYMLKSRNNASQRYQYKRRLMELLLQDEKKGSRDEIAILFYFIDFLLEIPEEMTRDLQNDIGHLTGKEVGTMDETLYPDPPTLKPFLDKKREEGKLEVVRAMLKEGFPVKTIAKVTGFSEKMLNDIRTEEL